MSNVSVWFVCLLTIGIVIGCSQPNVAPDSVGNDQNAEGALMFDEYKNRGVKFTQSEIGRITEVDAYGASFFADGDLERILVHGELDFLDVRQTRVKLSQISFDRLKHLKVLLASGTEVDDSVMERLASHCHVLERLDVSNTRISNDGLAPFANHRGLRNIEIHGNAIGDDGISHLKNVPLLESIAGLEGDVITDQGVIYLTEMQHLKAVGVGSDRVTDRGIEEFSGHPSLEELWLKGSGVTGSCLTELANAPKLRKLVLEGTAVDDETLMLMATSKSIRFINVSLTRVTRNGVEQFRKQRPDVEVVIF